MIQSEFESTAGIDMGKRVSETLRIGDGRDWHFFNEKWIDGENGLLTIPEDKFLADGIGMRAHHYAFYLGSFFKDVRVRFEFRSASRCDVGIILRARGESRFYVFYIPNCGMASRSQNFWASFAKMDESGYFKAIKTELVRRVPGNWGVWRCSGGGITLKHVNEIENNIIVDCRKCGSLLVRRSPAFGAVVRRNICVQYRRNIKTNGQIPPFYDGGGFDGKLDEAIMDDNVFFCPDQPEEAESFLAQTRKNGQDAHSVAIDPGFSDIESGDFSLSQDAPALQVGFRPIEKWGLRTAAGRVDTEENKKRS